MSGLSRREELFPSPLSYPLSLGIEWKRWSHRFMHYAECTSTSCYGLTGVRKDCNKGTETYSCRVQHSAVILLRAGFRVVGTALSGRFLSLKIAVSEQLFL